MTYFTKLLSYEKCWLNLEQLRKKTGGFKTKIESNSGHHKITPKENKRRQK